ncbi:unnamed protein product, partial [Mycena citricolor]
PQCDSDAQNVSEISLSGVPVLVSRSQSSPQAVLPSAVLSGSLTARSKNTTSVGETTIASSATIPVVPFCTNDQAGDAAADTPVEASAMSATGRLKATMAITHNWVQAAAL